MTYKLHEGIVYAKVSGIHLLIATRSVWDKFDSVKQLSPLQGCFCYGIVNGMSEDQLIDYLILPPNLKKDSVRNSYQRFIKKMINDGYLIEEGEINES